MKTKHVLFILILYILSFVIGFFASLIAKEYFYQLLIFDVVATICIYVSGVIVNNSSVYDPYWSFTPWIMALYSIIYLKAYSLINIIFFVVFTLWSFRLTFNWMVTFKGIGYEDWRYQMYREKYPKIWQLVNFFGINFMPTVLVFIGFIPIIYLFKENNNNYLSLIGIGIILIGITLEFIADREMHAFLRRKEMRTCDLGLWKYSRHPNYLGEISIWVGVFCTYALNTTNFIWYLGIGAVLMYLLFTIVSIPLMEKRQVQRRADYKQYQMTTSRLLLLPRIKRA